MHQPQAIRFTVLWSLTSDRVVLALLDGQPIDSLVGGGPDAVHTYITTLTQLGWEPDGTVSSAQRVETHYFKRRAAPARDRRTTPGRRTSLAPETT